MTDPVAIVRTRLLAISAVTALVGTRVYAGALPQNVSVPAISVQRIFSSEDSHLRGSSGVYEARVQVHAVASTRSGAVAVQDAVAGNGAGSALSHFSGLVSSVRVLVILPDSVEREDMRDVAGVREFEVMRAYMVKVVR